MKEQAELQDPRLERYALGTLSGDELARLRADADHDEALAGSLELHAPLSALLKANVARAALRSRRPHLARWAGGGAVFLAVAASVLLVSRASVEPIPEYALSAQAGDMRWRGDEVAGPALREDSEVTIVLRPERSVEDELVGQLWIEAKDGAFRSTVSPEISKDGAVRWLGTASALSGARTGEVTFVAVVGRPNALPERPPTEASGSGWRCFRVQVQIIPRDGGS